jgi:hypothetical protein
LRVYLIGENYQPAEVDLAEVAGRFAAWLSDDANPVLTDVIQGWLWQPADAGGLGARAGSAWDVALLRAEITAAWQQGEGR